jgi:glycosyltransferase involved in cell wall biosynthesis
VRRILHQRGQEDCVTSPRIVVGMGVFNEEQYLEETIPAVLAQTMPDFRLLILENGSTDRSADILARFSDADPRVNVVRAPINMPPAEAANYGWGLAMQWWPECRWFMG